MARYIDLDGVADRLLNAWNTADEQKRADIVAIMANIVTPILVGTPTADVVEVRHGEWEKDTDKVRDDGEIYDYRCSLCKGEAHEGEYGNNDVLADFCHHCGAKMDGGKAE